ncbi:hypothetical protein [uncultured Akkermansia sp.]|uniref:hypothetical protein n=1 Tax=uncultured Akkermansia sp. TaxID=512294 RepID=UPI002805DA0E|nr:hypothetical protein [uncultured Akkermansia sp.]
MKLIIYAVCLCGIITTACAQLGMSLDELQSKWGKATTVDKQYPYNYLSENCWDRSVGKESEYGYRVIGWNKKEYTIYAIIHPLGKCVGLRISRTDKKSISKSAAYKLRDLLCPKQKFVTDKARTKEIDNQAKQTGELYTSGWIREFAIASNKYISTYSYQIDKEGKTISPAILQIDDIYPDRKGEINNQDIKQATLRYIGVSQITPDGILSLTRKHMLLTNVPNKENFAEGDAVIGLFVDDGIYKYTSVLGTEKSIHKIRWVDYPPLPHISDARRRMMPPVAK